MEQLVWRAGCGAALASLLLPALGSAQPFQLPTANRALFEKGGEERFFVGTVGKPWTTGTFGCVRSGGNQMHEGLDIRCLQRDKHGEPIDPVLATADGTVVYINNRPALSNYGKYVVLRHQVENLEVYSLYAHLSQIRPELKPGQNVKAGQPVALMGRTTNTRSGISKDRAHVHFELDLLLNDRFAVWYQKASPDQRNDHGEWNGQNLLGLDPRLILLEQQQKGARFNLLEFVQHRPELCRVLVRKPDFPWARRYGALIRRNALAEKQGVAGYEVALDFNGVPFELVPRTASDIRGQAAFQLLAVNASEYHRNPARRLVVQKGVRWELSPHGLNLLGLLTY